MMLSVVPMYASAAEALSASNVTQWPTISYKNADGKMYFGQSEADALILNDDETVTDANGNVVAGHFEFINSTTIPTSKGTKRADVKFVPDDENTYSGFEAKRNRYVTYTVTETKPVFVDEINDPVVASEVEHGALLSTSILSGGAMKNPYNPEEPNILSAEWIWSPSVNEPSTTVITSSGYYTAQFAVANYSLVTAQVYVKVKSNIPETTITEYPIIPELTYNPDVTWADIELTGGKAVIKGTETEVAGTFAIKDTRLAATPNPNFTEIEVVFTPADPEAALPYEFTIPVKVNPAHISFVDGEGNAVVEGFEFEVEPGTKMGDVRALLNAVLRVPANSIIQVEDSNSYAQNGRTYKLTVLYDENVNYTGKELYFTVKFKNVELTPTFAPGYLKSSIRCGDYRPAGTFTVSLDGKEIAEVKANEEFTYTVENSGDHIFSAKYNPAENDYFIIADFESTVNVKFQRLLTCVNTVSDGNNTYYPGDKVEISANLTAENFAGWKVTDKAGNEVTVEGVDNTKRIITITMPDYDIHVEALNKNASSEGTGGIDDIFGGLDMDELTQGDSEWAIINIIRNIIAKFKSFLQQLIETFQSIGG